MVRLKVKMTKMWNWILRRKVADLDNDGKIESLYAEVEGVFSSFKRMHNQLTSVNDKLLIVVNDELRTKELAEQRILKAEEQYNANNKLQEKLNDFIV